MSAIDWNGALRKRAEACLRAGGPTDEPPLVHELRVHRIELELQNETLRETQVELEASRERYRRLFEMAPVGYVVLDAAGVVLEANARAIELLGRDLVNTRLAHHLDAREGRDFQRHLEAVLQRDEAQACELWTGGTGAQARRLRFESVATTGERGRRNRCLTAIVDLTAQRRLEAEVLQAQRMETLGRLVAGIAHDFGNVLAVVTGAAMVGLRNASETDAVQQALCQITKASAQGTSLVRRLLAFARPGADAAGAVDLKALLDDTAPLLAHLLGNAVTLRVDAATDLGAVRCDAGELTQALMNLVSNARDAMPAGGTVLVQTALWKIDEREARRLGASSPGAYGALLVSDGGHGMDEDTRARLFEPFFSTKPRGRGTGLGLASVRNLVQRAGGAIDVQSELGVGTMVTLLFPLAERPPEASAGPANCVVFVEEIDRSR